MSRQQKKKRQHYVPKLILRNFSQDGHQIGLRVLATGQEITGAGLKEQCYENYFYGIDGEIEDAFAKTEDEFSKIIGNLDRVQLEAVTAEQIHSLREFVHYQRMRTLAAAEDINTLNDALAKAVLSKDSRFGDIDWSQVQIKQENPQHFSLYQAIGCTPLLRDLDAKFLISKKRTGFIISDDPVVNYNQFADHHPVFSHWPGTRGLALKGLQMLLPLSPQVYLAIYDPSAYEYGSPKKRVCEVSMHDVRLLNALQVLNAHRCIYFDPNHTPKEELDRLGRERNRFGDWRKPRLFEGPLTRRADGQLSQFVGFNTPEIRLGSQFNFSKVIDRADYTGYNRGHIPLRSPELLELANAYSEFLRKKVETRRQEKQSKDNAGNQDGQGGK